MKIELNWSDETKNARGQLVSTASPSQEFWQVWRERKTAVKAAGYSVRKDGGAWVVTRYRDDVASIEASQAVSSDMDIPVPAGLSYLPYQVAGIAYAANRPATLIGDEMGLGKTIQAIGVINATNPSTVLVVCPASLKINWANEMEKWLVAERSIAIVNAFKTAKATGPAAAIVGPALAATAAAGVTALFSSKVPKLAEGGITTKETLAIVGDNPSGREAILPLEKLDKIMRSAISPLLNPLLDPLAAFRSPSLPSLQPQQAASGNLSGRLEGGDILISSERSSRRRRRVRNF